MQQIILTVLLLLLMAVPVGAAQVTDALGRTVQAEVVPQRIVSLVPAVTEILYALGLEDRIAGVTSFCNYPPEARSKPKIGEYASPSLEVMATIRPDLVFMSADASSPEFLRRLETLGIPVYVVYPRSVNETIELIRSMGRLLQRQPVAEPLALEMERTVACARRLTASLPRVRVLCTVMSQPLVVAGRKTLLDDLINLAGGENVVPEGLNRYPTWGIESVLAANPDVILVSPHPGQVDPSAYYRGWPELKAVQAERLVTIDADWIQRPGPRLMLGLASLTKALHDMEISPEGTCRE